MPDRFNGIRKETRPSEDGLEVFYGAEQAEIIPQFNWGIKTLYYMGERNRRCITKRGLATTKENTGSFVMKDGVQSLAHSKCRCKYQIQAKYETDYQAFVRCHVQGCP